jgi:hypothetical protein
VSFAAIVLLKAARFAGAVSNIVVMTAALLEHANLRPTSLSTPWGACAPHEGDVSATPDVSALR